MPRIFAVLILLVASLHPLSARTHQEVPELAKIFQMQDVEGTFVLFDIETDTMRVSDEARARKRFTPASTLKIANSLIGLDVGAEPENGVYPFALNIDMRSDADAAKRIPIGRDCLKALGKL